MFVFHFKLYLKVNKTHKKDFKLKNVELSYRTNNKGSQAETEESELVLQQCRHNNKTNTTLEYVLMSLSVTCWNFEGDSSIYTAFLLSFCVVCVSSGTCASLLLLLSTCLGSYFEKFNYFKTPTSKPLTGQQWNVFWKPLYKCIYFKKKFKKYHTDTTTQPTIVTLCTEVNSRTYQTLTLMLSLISLWTDLFKILRWKVKQTSNLLFLKLLISNTTPPIAATVAVGSS